MSSPQHAYQTLKQLVEHLQHDAQRGCGLVWELYTRRFSTALDRQFPPGHPQREAVLLIASDDYCTPEELQAQAEADAANGYCHHGLTLDCCPVGCGDRDDY